MEYQFRPTPELIWFVLTAVVAVVAQALTGAPPTDWRVWGVSIAAAAVRAAVGALLSYTTTPEPKG